MSDRRAPVGVDEIKTRAGLPATPVPAFASAPAPAIATGGTWLLTGATGWWGRHAARALLGTDLRTHVLAVVRAASDEQALARLRAAWCPTTATNERAERERWWARVRVLAVPDAATPWPVCPTQRVDAVLHAAASLSLAAAPAQAVPQALALARRAWEWGRLHGALRFDHVSTLSVWVAGMTPPGRVHEADALERAGQLWGGYAAGKWAAEAWLAHAARADRAPALAVHRLGLIAHSVTDGWAPGEGLGAVVAAARRWGCPAWFARHVRTPEAAVDLSPTTRTVAGVLAAARGGGTGPFHWAATQLLYGSDLARTLEDRFERCRDWPAAEPLGKAARRALGRWSDPERAARAWWHDVFQSDRHRYDASRAQVWEPRWLAGRDTLNAWLETPP